MKDPFEKTKTVLKVYLERGKAAIQAAHRNDSESLEEILVSRKAAFNNFRYWDYVSSQYDESYAARGDFQELWSQIRVANTELESAIDKTCRSIHQQLVKTSLNREKLSKFRSRSEITNGFRFEI